METFKTMLNTKVTPGKLILVKHVKIHQDICGIIGLSGGAKGSIILTFPRITALKAVSEFIGEKVLAIDEVVKDAIGELANIVAGAAKKDLAQYKISISLPTVIIGDGHEVQGGKDVIPMAVPFESPLGLFHLIVSFKSEV
ncbi:MAG: chemotaxis protein CheX [Fibrobacteria bacterium]